MQFSFFRNILLLTTLLSSLSLAGHAQANIQEQFEEFYNTQTSTWQEYKLVKMPRLKEFWQIVSDTLGVKQGQISTAQAKIKSLNSTIGSLEEELKNTQEALEQSETMNDSITFMGMDMSKSGYSTLVWVIIFSLLAGIVSLYLLYMNNSHTTREARKHLAKVEEEYTKHQIKARENQTKLKRELQTALNTLQEHRIKM